MSADTLVDFTGGATVVSDGPIVGTDEPALRIPATDYLTTGDLTQGAGDAGDAGGVIFFAVEFWLRTPTTGTQQILAQGPNAHIAVPNRQWTVYLAAGGQIKFDYVDSTNTNHSLTGSTILRTGSWYHVVVTKDTTQRIYLNGVLDGSQLAAAGQWGDLVGGTADMRIGGTTTTYALDFAEFVFYRDSLSAAQALAHYQAGAQRGFPEQESYDRLIAVLDQVASMAPRGGTVSLSVGPVTPRYMTGQAALDLIREMAASDIGGSAVTATAMFFIDASGGTMWLFGGHRNQAPWNTVQATFGDQTGELAYEDLALDYSDSYLVNEVNVTREGTARVAGQTQTRSDATSISRYGRRPLDISGVPLSLDALSDNMAVGLLAKYKDPMQRILGITLSTIDPDVALAAFQREIADKITILRTPPGGGARIQQDVWIQKIEISGTNDGTPLAISWAVSPL